MKTVIFLGSYSGGGASTAIKLLREMGIPCVSTNETLYELSEGIDELVDSFSGAAISYTKYREYRVRLAEDVIKKVFGKDVFCVRVAKEIRSYTLTHDAVAVDCFNREDHSFIRAELNQGMPHYKPITINIRSPKEQPDTDGQELLECGYFDEVHEIQNPITEEGLRAELQKLISVPTVPHMQSK